MLNKEFTYIIVGLVVILAMYIIETINNEESRIYFESASQLVGGMMALAVSVALWPVIVVSRILNKI